MDTGLPAHPKNTIPKTRQVSCSVKTMTQILLHTTSELVKTKS